MTRQFPVAADARRIVFGEGLAGNAGVSNYALDVAATAWRAVTPVPTGRSGPLATLASDGRIYVMGGDYWTGFGWATRAVVEVYDPASDHWSTVAPMTTARAYGGAATMSDGRLVVFGGSALNGRTQFDSVEFYDPVTDRWSVGPSLPMAVGAMGAANSSDGFVHLVGGRNDAGMLNSTHLGFDLARGTYRSFSALPTSLGNLGLVESPTGTLLAIGGTGASGHAVSTVFSYSIGLNTWR